LPLRFFEKAQNPARLVSPLDIIKVGDSRYLLPAHWALVGSFEILKSSRIVAEIFLQPNEKKRHFHTKVANFMYPLSAS
jgi:hypothetical protein